MGGRYRNRSTGDTVDDTDGSQAERLDRLSDRWERLDDDGEGEHLGSGDVDQPDDEGARLTNSDVAGELEHDVPSSPPAKPAGESLGEAAAEAVADGAERVAEAASSSSTSSDADTSTSASTTSSDSSSSKATPKRSRGNRSSSGKGS